MYSSTAAGNTNNFSGGYASNSYASTSSGTNTTGYGVKGRNSKQSKHEMSNMECKPDTSNNGANGTNKRPSPGVFTCQACNALFTCLQIFQQHRKHHAACSGVKLLGCNHCPYSTENNFHYNWHIMSHSGESPHSCNVCVKPDENDPSTTNQNIKLEAMDDEPSANSPIGKRSVATATTDDLLLLGTSTTPRRYSSEREIEDENNHHLQATHYVPGPFSPSSHNEQSYLNHDGTNQRTSFTQAAASDDEGLDDSHLRHNDTGDLGMHHHQQQLNGVSTQVEGEEDDISDEDDDEEEEVESEEDDGEDDEDEEGGYQQHADIQQNTTANHGASYNDGINQGPPYTKSPHATPGTVPVTPTRGRGKGNRKSRAISGSQDGSDGDGSGGGELRRKFHCSHCGKSFKTKSHLQRHILTHTGEKPYHCNRCGSKFNQSSSLRNHIIAIHTKEYPHYCTHCSKGFLMPALLHKHLATSHRNK